MFRIIKNAIFLLFIIFNTPIISNGQDVTSFNPTIPTSPQAEAFKRYGDYSINYSTGVPNISIPLYEINHRGYKMPITLKYYPQPLKPGYNYDVYGHGWGLSINSSISRAIEYVPDEWRDFKLEEDVFNYYYYNCPSCVYDCWYSPLCEVANEGHVDIFSYNLAYDRFNAVLPDGPLLILL